MSRVRVAINGLGRIGRAFLKLAVQRPEIELVAVNDLGDLANLVYLLRYDSVYGHSSVAVEQRDGNLVVAGQPIRFLQEKDPGRLPWADFRIDVVVESTGIFESYLDARRHLDAGAHKVVISAPAKGDSPPGVNGATVLVGINESCLSTCQISSNASCTTNAASPVIKIMMESPVGIAKALLNTVHAYTASQRLVDSPAARDFRRGRSAAVNIVPSTTGAARAVTKAVTDLDNLFDGLALRVPVLAGSIVDITFVAKKPTSGEEVNEILRRAAADQRWQGIFTVSEEPLVSSDILGNPHASIADLAFTKVVGGDLVKILSWYDNEVGYAATLVRHVIAAGRAT